MLKSNKDTTQIFRSLGPDNANFKTAVNASVREAEHRWPLLKITPPKKFDLTPNLSEEEKGRWLSSSIVKTENFKHALSVQSSTSKDKMAESLKKMAGTKIKSQPTPSKSKPMDVKTEVEVQEGLQKQSSTEVKKTTKLKNVDALKKIAEVKSEFEKVIGVEPRTLVEVKKKPVKKKMEKMLSASTKAEAVENKSLRGIFDRLTGRKPVVLPPPTAPVKSSVLRKLSMR